VKAPRAFILLAGILLSSLFFWPMWRITLLAPQYPDGVHMYIYIDKIGGATEGTLQNVNILNHYIGMKPITPDAIPELKFMPAIVGFFVAFAVVAFLADKKWIYITWTITFIAVLIAGIYDFYLWEYDYGHSLDPKAPMKFEGESFQPPLIGKKEIINFTAISLPHIGGYMMILSAVLGGLAAYLKSRITTKRNAS
jgi:copper chaperone NosL